MNLSKEISKGLRLGLSVVLALSPIGLRGSVQMSEQNRKMADAGIKLVDMHLRAGQDIPESDKIFCKDDRDANPKVANPIRFTKKCVNGDGTPNHFDVDGWGNIQ